MRDWIARQRWIATLLFAMSLLAVAAASLGSVAFLQLPAIEEGTYDPVQDDGFRPEEVPALKQRLKYISTASAAVGVLGIAGLWATRWGTSLVRVR